MNKVYPSVDEAIADVFDGACIVFSGFFIGGPVYLIQALIRKGVRDLTVISGDIGVTNDEMNELVINGQVKKAISCYPFWRSVTKGASSPIEQAAREGRVEVEVYPMGTFIEKLRAGGAGIAGFYTPAGVGTVIERGKEKRTFGDREYLLELALRPDYAFIHAYQGDPYGNLVYRKTSRTYSPEMAMSAKITIAEVENLVEPGEIDPDHIHTPGIYVQRVVKVDRPKKTFQVA